MFWPSVFRATSVGIFAAAATVNFDGDAQRAWHLVFAGLLLLVIANQEEAKGKQ